MPNPKSGESESDYVSRFMASAEAQKDFPDEKQRAAVAYSKFRENHNSTDLCRKCGALVLVNADSFIQHCDLCGDRVMGRQTPAIEKLGNICPFCQHPVAPEHDSFGCHVPGCSCAMTDAAVDDMIRAVLPNTASGLNAAAGVWDKADNPRRVELLKQASIADSAGGLVHLTFSQIPDREQKQIARTLGFENQNTNLSKFCSVCLSRLGGKSPEGLDGFVQDGTMHVEGNLHGTALCGVKAIENKNASDLGSIWDMAYQPSLERLLQKHGLDTDMANRKWKDLPQDVRSQVSQDLPSLHENSNASPDFQEGDRVKGRTGEIGTVVTIDQHGRVIVKEDSGRTSEWHPSNLILQNSAPDFQAAMAAFEAHCEVCAECKAGSDAADVSKLCAEGSQLLVADLKNADGMHYRCEDCSFKTDEYNKAVAHNKTTGGKSGSEDFFGSPESHISGHQVVIDIKNADVGGIPQVSMGHQQPTSTTAARPGKKDDIENAGDKAEIRRKIAALKPLIEREKDTSSDKFKELVREAGRLGEELDKMENASDSSKDAEQIKRLAEGIEHEADEIAAQEPVLASSREATGAQRYGSACS